MLSKKTFNAAYISHFMARSGFTECDAPRTFNCDDCGQTIKKGSSYYARTLSTRDGVESVCVCFKCATGG